MGSSAALHLLRSGYRASNIHGLDSFPIPSKQSAGYDLNKLFGRMGTSFEAKLAEEAYEKWTTDPVFVGCFHQTGRITAASSEKGVRELTKQYQELLKEGLADEYEWLDDREAFIRHAQQLKLCSLDGWKGIYNPHGGWMAAKDAIDSVGRELVREGVKLTFGASGSFRKPILGSDGATVIGVECVDGSRHHADKVIIAGGAYTPALIDLEDQCVAKAWVYGHIKLSPEEAAEYKNIPTVYNGDYGFFFEPTENGVIKLCDEFPGFTHMQMHQPFGASKPRMMSVPRTHAENPSDTIPDASRATIRRALETFLPQHKDKPLFNTALCWCADTSDGRWLLSEHPRFPNLIIASGDNGSSFKYLPIVGRYIVQCLEGSLPKYLADTWRWRPGLTPLPLQGRREAEAEDLADKPGWQTELSLDELKLKL